MANGARVRRWFQEKKAGWYAVLEDPQMPVTSTLLDQAHNAIERKLFAMKGFHHIGGSQQAFLTAWPLYNLVPYQRRAQHAGQCGVEVEAGDYRQETGCSICKSSPPEGFDERWHPLPLNSLECEISRLFGTFGGAVTLAP